MKALSEHLGAIDDPHEPWRVAHPLPEVSGTVCDDDLIAGWGEARLDVLRRCYLPYHHGVSSGRWPTLPMNRVAPGLFATAFTDGVRAT